MGNPLAVVRQLVDADDRPDGRYVAIWCPGCEEIHAPRVAGEAGERPAQGPCWDFDDNLEAPTFAPSLLVFGPIHAEGHRPSSEDRCHSFIRAGSWEYLSDSTHRLAGQTVPMVPVPDYWVR